MIKLFFCIFGFMKKQITKRLKYELYPTVDQRRSFDGYFLSNSVYYNFILGMWVTAYRDFPDLLKLKSADDKLGWLGVIIHIGQKTDKDGELIFHNNWARLLAGDVAAHASIFYMRKGTPKKSWVDIAEACATYAIRYYERVYSDGLVDRPGALLLCPRAILQETRDAVKNAVQKFYGTRTVADPFKGFPKFKTRRNPVSSFNAPAETFPIYCDFVSRKLRFGSAKWDIGEVKFGKGNVPDGIVGWGKSDISSAVSDDGSKSKRIRVGGITIGASGISMTPTGRYYYTVVVDTEVDIPDPVAPEDVELLGVDTGIGDRFCTTSDGEVVDNPKFYRNVKNRLAHAQHILAKRTKLAPNGKPLREQSKGYHEQALVVAKLHEKIRNMRETFQHQLSSRLVNDPGVDGIVLETLGIQKSMTKTKSDKTKSKSQKSGINRANSDAAIGQFQRFVAYKCDWVGKYCVKVDQYFKSSQLCSVCGHVNPEVKDLSIRIWVCPSCNTEHDRDVNAGVNLKVEGKRKLIEEMKKTMT